MLNINLELQEIKLIITCYKYEDIETSKLQLAINSELRENLNC